MRYCRNCGNPTKGHCDACGYENKHSSEETIWKLLVKYNNSLPSLVLKKKLWVVFKPILNKTHKEVLKQNGLLD